MVQYFCQILPKLVLLISCIFYAGVSCWTQEFFQGRYSLEWVISGDNVITFKASAKTSGWVGLGLNANYTLAKASFAVGGVFGSDQGPITFPPNPTTTDNPNTATTAPLPVTFPSITTPPTGITGPQTFPTVPPPSPDTFPTAIPPHWTFPTALPSKLRQIDNEPYNHTFFGDEASMWNEYFTSSWRILDSVQTFANGSFITSVTWERDLVPNNFNETTIDPYQDVYLILQYGDSDEVPGTIRENQIHRVNLFKPGSSPAYLKGNIFLLFATTVCTYLHFI